MRASFRLLATLVFVVALIIGAFLVGMHFHDGPLEIISGGPFRTGALSTSPMNWDFIKDRQEIEFQTLNPTTSRTVWLGVVESRLFLVSGYMNTGYGRLWKQWPHYLTDDDRIILRIDGNLYEQRLARVMGGEIVAPVLSEFSRKYGFSAASDDSQVTGGDTWMFEVIPR